MVLSATWPGGAPMQIVTPLAGPPDRVAVAA
jgi:hypothetical protein